MSELGELIAFGAIGCALGVILGVLLAIVRELRRRK